MEQSSGAEDWTKLWIFDLKVDEAEIVQSLNQEIAETLSSHLGNPAKVKESQKRIAAGLETFAHRALDHAEDALPELPSGQGEELIRRFEQLASVGLDRIGGYFSNLPVTGSGFVLQEVERKKTWLRLQLKSRRIRAALGTPAPPPQRSAAGAAAEGSTDLKFDFVTDPALRSILQRDYAELQRGHQARCWKSVIVLAGGAIEAILTDALLLRKDEALAATAAPNKSIDRWDLASLLTVALELDIVSGQVAKLSDSVREFRNLVHPGLELRQSLHFSEEEAVIAHNVLKIICRGLSNSDPNSSE